MKQRSKVSPSNSRSNIVNNQEDNTKEYYWLLIIIIITRNDILRPWQSTTPNCRNLNKYSVPVADLGHQSIAPMCTTCESGAPSSPVICREDLYFYIMKHEIFSGIVSLLNLSFCRGVSHALNP